MRVFFFLSEPSWNMFSTFQSCYLLWNSKNLPHRLGQVCLLLPYLVRCLLCLLCLLCRLSLLLLRLSLRLCLLDGAQTNSHGAISNFRACRCCACWVNKSNMALYHRLNLSYEFIISRWYKCPIIKPSHIPKSTRQKSYLCLLCCLCDIPKVALQVIPLFRQENCSKFLNFQSVYIWSI